MPDIQSFRWQHSRHPGDWLALVCSRLGSLPARAQQCKLFKKLSTSSETKALTNWYRPFEEASVMCVINGIVGKSVADRPCQQLRLGRRTQHCEQEVKLLYVHRKRQQTCQRHHQLNAIKSVGRIIKTAITKSCCNILFFCGFLKRFKWGAMGIRKYYLPILCLICIILGLGVGKGW